MNVLSHLFENSIVLMLTLAIFFLSSSFFTLFSLFRFCLLSISSLLALAYF